MGGNPVEARVFFAANSAGAPPHTHAHEDEFFYVREGTVTFMANGDRKTIGPGGFVMLPRHSLRAVWNASKTYEEVASHLLACGAKSVDEK